MAFLRHLVMRATAGAAAFGALAVLAVPAGAASVADFYRGKNLSLIIGFPPGGGYDAYARSVGAHIGRHLPGKPGVVVRNMPGASGLRAANFIYNAAPRDGTSFGIYSAGTVFAPLFGNKKAKYETAKFTWIGNVEKSVGSCATWHTSGFKSFNDLLNRAAIFGAGGVTGVQSEFPRSMNALIGTRIKVIHGYAGGTGALLAMKRGEVHGGCAFALSTLKSVRRGDWKAGRLKVLIQLGFEKHPDFGKTPHIYDFAKSKDDRKVMELIFGRQTLGRPLGGPPALPAARTKALRAAFSATVKDPAFLKAAGRRRLNIDPMSGEEVDKLIARFQSYPEPIVARARAALKLGKVVKVKLKKANGVIAKISKKKLTIKDGKGGTHSYKLHRRRSKVTIAGKKAKASALKAGMSCALRHYGENDLARKIDCK